MRHPSCQRHQVVHSSFTPLLLWVSVPIGKPLGSGMWRELKMSSKHRQHRAPVWCSSAPPEYSVEPGIEKFQPMNQSHFRSCLSTKCTVAQSRRRSASCLKPTSEAQCGRPLFGRLSCTACGTVSSCRESPLFSTRVLPSSGWWSFNAEPDACTVDRRRGVAGWYE